MGIVTLEDVASFSELKDCSIELGDPGVGFIRIDGGGVIRKGYTYGRFLLFNETSGLPSPEEVLAAASVFRVTLGSTLELLTREQFEKQLERIRKLAGIP